MTEPTAYLVEWRRRTRRNGYVVAGIGVLSVITSIVLLDGLPQLAVRFGGLVLLGAGGGAVFGLRRGWY